MKSDASGFDFFYQVFSVISDKEDARRSINGAGVCQQAQKTVYLIFCGFVFFNFVTLKRIADFDHNIVYSKIEGSQATARYTVELLRSVISQQRVPHANQASALIDAVKAVGEQLVAANPVGMCF